VSDQPVTPRPAATVLMLRDGPKGMEVFMVKRHHQIDFATGALVFPGGSVDPGDSSATVRARCDGAEGLNDEELSFRVASVREAFEETGLLLCRRPDTDHVLEAEECDALAPYRDKLEANELDFGQFLDAEDLICCLNRLAHFAHWITPAGMPKRFDTHFFLARAPADHLAVHDGHESVDSVWIRPADVLEQAARGQRTVIFPTLRNVEKLANFATVDDALAGAAAAAVVRVLPWTERREDGVYLCIQPEAGYAVSEEKMPERPA